ncbi:MAG: alpha/beta hydrolase family protein [Balneolaceae bacterium]
MLKKTRLPLLIILLSFPVLVFGQSGVILESLSLSSEILDKEVEYSIYLPEDYEHSNRNYPVLYLLHGYSDDEIAWTQYGEVQEIADKEMESINTVPMIIVMPDAGVSWYINNHDGTVRYEDFFIQELIPYVDYAYRTRPDKRFRAIAGLSMGGHGALIMALKHPELFASAAPLSSGIFTEEEFIGMPQQTWDNVFGPPYGPGLEGEERITSHFRENFILDLVQSEDPEALQSVRYYIDCGDKDFLIKGNMELHALMIDREIPHEFRVREGEHTWEYWRTALPEVLRFVSSGFQQ